MEESYLDSEDFELMLQMIADNEIQPVSTNVKCQHCDNDDVNTLIWSQVDETVVELDCCRCSGMTQLTFSADHTHDYDVFDDVDDYHLDESISDSLSHVECVECGNAEGPLFEFVVSPSSGQLESIRCLICDVTESFYKPSSYLECAECHNTNGELFGNIHDDRNHLVAVRCFVCDVTLPLPSKIRHGSTRPTVTPSPVAPRRQSASVTKMEHSQKRTRIRNLALLRPGDHIAFHRLLIWHHAIVVDVTPSTNQVTMIHYNGTHNKVNGHFASVRQEPETIDAEKCELYRYEYDGKCYGPREVIQRARSRLGEAKYNAFTRNCEHFARWCKVGEERCFQTDTVKQRAITTGVSSFVKPAEQGIVGGIRCALFREVADEVFKIGTGGLSCAKAIQTRAADVVSGATKLATGVKWGALGGCIAVNFLIEGISFGVECHRLRQKLKRNSDSKIEKDDFRQQLAKTGCESIGGLIGSIAGGLLQLLIPFPILPGLVGSFLGNVICRAIGAAIGKKLHSAITKR